MVNVYLGNNIGVVWWLGVYFCMCYQSTISTFLPTNSFSIQNSQTKRPHTRILVSCHWFERMICDSQTQTPHLQQHIQNSRTNIYYTKTEEQFSAAVPVNSETQLVSGTDDVTVFLQLISALRLWLEPYWGSPVAEEMPEGGRGKKSIILRLERTQGYFQSTEKENQKRRERDKQKAIIQY